MFVQIHMLQSLPPGNLNRDDTGQPKKCIFGGVTRGRISSQCLKRNIRRGPDFSGFLNGASLRSQYLPRLIVEKLADESNFSDEEAQILTKQINKKFTSDKSSDSGTDNSQGDKKNQQNELATKQLVFFTKVFVQELAELISEERQQQQDALKTKKAKEGFYARFFNEHVGDIASASEKLTPDIALFGRMTTSDLLVDIEATCQVAHAIGTHETIIEGDYFTALDDLQEGPAAAYLGSGDGVTFFDYTTYYKYFNIDIESLRDKDHMTEAFSLEEAADLVGLFLRDAATNNPTGKQNAFASHGRPELILVECSQTKQPISYANAFLKAVSGENHMTASTEALKEYIDSVGAAYAPQDLSSIILQVGSAAEPKLKGLQVKTIDEMIKAVKAEITKPAAEPVAEG